jgi:hypothetical protein
MAFEMEYEDKSGVTHPASYWRVGQTNLSQATKNGSIAFLGYASAAARLAGKQPIDAKTYHIAPQEYDAFFAPDDLSPEGKNPVSQAYLYALSVKEGVAPAEGDDDRVSFFDGAESV